MISKANRLRLILTMLFIVTFIPFQAQTNAIKADSAILDYSLIQLKKHYDIFYGLDYELYNGLKYYPVLKSDKGNPFFKGDKPHTSTLFLQKLTYDSLKLMYDINKQNFILEYNELNGAINRIILNTQQINRIELGNDVFVKNEFEIINHPFIQLVFEDKIACYFTWSKDYMFKNTGTFTGYKFSEEIRTIYFLIDGTLSRIKNNKSFLKLFDNETKKKLSSYLQKNKINTKKAKKNKILELARYCNSLFIE